jgi:hypothetical protein
MEKSGLMGCPTLPKGCRQRNRQVILDWEEGEIPRGADPIPCVCMQASQAGSKESLTSSYRKRLYSDRKLFIGRERIWNFHANFKIILTVYFLSIKIMFSRCVIFLRCNDMQPGSIIPTFRRKMLGTFSRPKKLRVAMISAWVIRQT